MTYKELVLELHLMILHDCLAVESAKEVLQNKSLQAILTATYEGVALRTHIEELIQINDSLSTPYIQKLGNIRKLFLGS